MELRNLDKSLLKLGDVRSRRAQRGIQSFNRTGLMRMDIDPRLIILGVTLGCRDGGRSYRRIGNEDFYLISNIMSLWSLMIKKCRGEGCLISGSVKRLVVIPGDGVLWRRGRDL